jgi:hypothetical protein
MTLTEQVQQLAKKFPSWDEFFFLVPPWNADEKTRTVCHQSFYNFLALRTNIDCLCLDEVNDFIGYLHSTRLHGYNFLTNLDNPCSPRMPGRHWFGKKAEEIKNTMGKNLELKILRGTAHAQKSEAGHSMLVFRPYDFAVFAKAY